MVLPDTPTGVLYISHRGEAVEVNKPRGKVDNANFVIQWNGKDWSGMMPLNQCLTRMMREADRRPSERFTIVEK
jgi:hypothetical protein